MRRASGPTPKLPPYPSRVGQEKDRGAPGCQAAHIASSHDTPRRARRGSDHTPGLEGFELGHHLSQARRRRIVPGWKFLPPGGPWVSPSTPSAHSPQPERLNDADVQLPSEGVVASRGAFTAVLDRARRRAVAKRGGRGR